MRGHLIGGAESAGAGAGAVRAGGQAWPRATAADLEWAVASSTPPTAAEARSAWWRAGERLATEAGGWLESRLSLEPGEGEMLAAEAASLTPPIDPTEGDRRPAVFRLDWRGLLGEVGSAVGAALASGRGCVLLGDPLLPELATAWGEALLAEGLDPGAVAVLHAPAPELDRALDRESGGAEWVGRPRARRLDVRWGDDVQAAAIHAARANFARVPALVGQRGGGPGLVYCDERAVAEFTSALLTELEELALEGPLRTFDPALGALHRQAVEAALDAGAAPIHGCEGVAEPSVLTNVPAESPVPPPGLPLLLIVRRPTPRSRGAGGHRGQGSD